MVKQLKAWLREKLLDTEDDVRYIQAESIPTGKDPEQRLEFWQRLRAWYATENGKAFQALMQREYQRIHAALLRAKPEEIAGLLAKMQQQNYIISLDETFEVKVKAWEKKVKAKQAGRPVDVEPGE